jgi:hypothetical protein
MSLAKLSSVVVPLFGERSVMLWLEGAATGELLRGLWGKTRLGSGVSRPHDAIPDLDRTRINVKLDQNWVWCGGAAGVVAPWILSHDIGVPRGTFVFCDRSSRSTSICRPIKLH